MAYYDYSDPAIAPQALSVTLSAIGGFILLSSGILFLVILARGMRAPQVDAGPYRFASPCISRRPYRSRSTGYALWVALMIGLTVTNYGYPILQLALRAGHVRAGRLCGSAVMSARDLFTFRNPLFRGSVGIAAGILVVTAIVGFIVLPSRSPGSSSPDVWDAICSAAGVPQRAASVRRPSRQQTPFRSRADLGHAGAPEPGVDRPRRDAGAALRDLPRPDRHQPRRIRPISPANTPP